MQTKRLKFKNKLGHRKKKQTRKNASHFILYVENVRYTDFTCNIYIQWMISVIKEWQKKVKRRAEDELQGRESHGKGGPVHQGPNSTFLGCRPYLCCHR